MEFSKIDNRQSFFKIGKYDFPINEAYFYYGNYETKSYGGKHIETGAGWTFQISTNDNKNLTPRHSLFGAKPRFYSEYSPIPLLPSDNLVGTQLFIKESWNEEENEPYFSLYVWEHEDLYNVKIDFIKKMNHFYWIEVDAMIPAGSIFTNPTRLTINTWIQYRQPDEK